MKDTLKIIIKFIIAAAVIAPTVLVLISMSKTDLLITVIVFVGGIALMTIPILMSEYIRSKRRSYHRPPPQNPGSAGRQKSKETQSARRQGQTGRSGGNRARFATQPFRKRSWREVLGFKEREKPTMHEVNSAWRRLAKSAHPDVGGTDAQMTELNAALSAARRELQHERPL